MKTKDFSLSVKLDDGDEGTFEGYASVFGVRDSYNEIVMPGAFVGQLGKRGADWPLMLWQHNPDDPIGVWEELVEDTKGLRGKGRLLKGVRSADEALIRLRAGAVKGLSIGYREVKVTEPKERGEARLLDEVELREVSIVSFPANRRATVTAVKNEENWDNLVLFMRALRDGEPRPIKEFEDLLREAGAPKSMAVQIASVGYAKAIRSESEGEKATNQAVAELRAAVSGFLKAS